MKNNVKETSNIQGKENNNQLNNKSTNEAKNNKIKKIPLTNEEYIQSQKKEKENNQVNDTKNDVKKEKGKEDKTKRY